MAYESEYKSVIWNPWHGCHKLGPGCERCYVYRVDQKYEMDTEKIKRTSTQFDLPIRKKRIDTDIGKRLVYKVEPGTIVETCIMSDFFIEEADKWRKFAWNFIRERWDCLFYISTRRPERIRDTLPSDWGDGWENVVIAVSVATQQEADILIPILLNDVVCKHKHILVSPILEEINLERYLSSGEIEQVSVYGEYEPASGRRSLARESNIDWVKSLSEQSKYYDTSFRFAQTGATFITNSGIDTVRSIKDNHELALMYNLDFRSDQGFLKETWKDTVKKLELDRLAEEASEVYHQVTLFEMRGDKHGNNGKL